MFSTTEEDDFFNVTINPTPTGSNLASLFGTSLTLKNDNASLVYTAPRTPKSGTEETSKSKPTVQSSVICTSFVDVFTIVTDKNQTSQGKCGLALIGNQTTKLYEIIIYKSKQNVISRTKLKPDFTFTLQDSNAALFCDDQNQQWKIHFENVKELNSFVDQIQKYGAKISLTLEKTSTSELKTSNENFTVKDSDVASDSSHSKSKASILSRMAKMGQPILPNNPSIHTDFKSSVTDSETDEAEAVKKPLLKKRHKVVSSNGDSLKSSNQSSSTPEFMIVNGQLLPVSSLHTTVPVIPNHMHSQLLLPNQLTMHPQLTSVQDPMNIFIAENRTHNCELRMNMSQLSSKLDTILAKIDKGSTNIVTENVSNLQATLAEKEKEIIETNMKYENLQKQYDVLNNYRDMISEYQQQIRKQKLEIMEQNKKIEELRGLLNEQAIMKEQQLQTISSLNTTISSLEFEIQTMNAKGDTSEMEKTNDLLKTLQDEITKKNSKTDSFAKTLKQSMNVLYQKIMENFEEESEYSGNQIKYVLSKTLKTSTMNIIQDFNKDFGNPSENLFKNSTNTETAALASEF